MFRLYETVPGRVFVPVSFGCLLLIRVPQQRPATEPSEEKQAFLDQFREGVRFYVTNPVLMMVLMTGILIFAWTSAFQVLGAFFVSQNLHAALSWYGIMGMASGAGFAVGAIVASVFASRVGVTRLFWSSMLVMGLLVIAYSRMTQLFGGTVAEREELMRVASPISQLVSNMGMF